MQGVFKFGERKKDDNQKMGRLEAEAGPAAILEDELGNMLELEDGGAAAAGPVLPPSSRSGFGEPPSSPAVPPTLRSLALPTVKRAWNSNRVAPC